MTSAHVLTNYADVISVLVYEAGWWWHIPMMYTHGPDKACTQQLLAPSLEFWHLYALDCIFKSFILFSKFFFSLCIFFQYFFEVLLHGDSEYKYYKIILQGMFKLTKVYHSHTHIYICTHIHLYKTICNILEKYHGIMMTIIEYQFLYTIWEVLNYEFW